MSKNDDDLKDMWPWVAVIGVVLLLVGFSLGLGVALEVLK